MRRDGILTTVFMAMVTCFTPAKAEVVDLAIGDAMPYVLKSARDGGPVSRLVRDAFKTQGVRINLHFVPWRRAMQNAKLGVYHGSYEWSKRTDLEPYFHFCTPYRQDRMVLFYNKKKPLNASTLEDLAGKVLACERGAQKPESLEPAIDRGLVKVMRTRHVGHSFRSLAAGKADIVYDSLSQGQITLRKELSAKQRENISYQTDLGIVREFRLIISKKRDPSGRLCDVFNRGLMKLTELGQHEEILASVVR